MLTYTTKQKLEDCQICLEDMDIGEVIGIVSCDHRYHYECIKKWIEFKNYSCPMCRGTLTEKHKHCGLEKKLIQRRVLAQVLKISTTCTTLNDSERMMSMLIKTTEKIKKNTRKNNLKIKTREDKARTKHNFR